MLPFKTIWPANTTPQQVKGTGGTSIAGKLQGYAILNNAAAQRYVKLYDKATAPTVGTDIPVVTIGLPAGSAGAGANVCLVSAPGPNGLSFFNGIWVAVTGGMADNDTTAPGASDVLMNLFYE